MRRFLAEALCASRHACAPRGFVVCRRRRRRCCGLGHHARCWNSTRHARTPGVGPVSLLPARLVCLISGSVTRGSGVASGPGELASFLCGAHLGQFVSPAWLCVRVGSAVDRVCHCTPLRAPVRFSTSGSFWFPRIVGFSVAGNGSHSLALHWWHGRTSTGFRYENSQFFSCLFPLES